MKKLLRFNKVTSETTTPTDLKLKLLLALIAIDLVVIAIHFYNSWIPDDQWNSFLSLANDDSIGELIQYAKWFLITVIFVLIAKQRSSLSYLAWALVFLYLLLDDWLGVHENLGGLIASSMQGLDLKLPGGLRLQDLGELGVSAIAGSMLLLISIWAYVKVMIFTKSLHIACFFVSSFGVFGVFIDVIAVMAYTGNISAFLFDVVEDGGEMFVASFMLWYAVLVSKANDLPVTFMDSVRAIFKSIKA